MSNGRGSTIERMTTPLEESMGLRYCVAERKAVPVERFEGAATQLCCLACQQNLRARYWSSRPRCSPTAARIDLTDDFGGAVVRIFPRKETLA